MHDLSDWNVLVVDDEPDNLGVIELVLNFYNASVRTAATAMECLEQMDAEAPTLLLVDIQMPVMDGFELMQRVRERAGVVNADEVVMWFDVGGALEVTDDASAEALVKGFATVPTLLEIVRDVGLAATSDVAATAAACELVLEALVARKKISRTDAGRYGRAVQEQRRRPNQDLFGGGMSA